MTSALVNKNLLRCVHWSCIFISKLILTLLSFKGSFLLPFSLVLAQHSFDKASQHRWVHLPSKAPVQRLGPVATLLDVNAVVAFLYALCVCCPPKTVGRSLAAHQRGLDRRLHIFGFQRWISGSREIVKSRGLLLLVLVVLKLFPAFVSHNDTSLSHLSGHQSIKI